VTAASPPARPVLSTAVALGIAFVADTCTFGMTGTLTVTAD